MGVRPAQWDNDQVYEVIITTFSYIEGKDDTLSTEVVKMCRVETVRVIARSVEDNH